MLPDNSVQIRLNNGAYALVDECDADLSQLNWTIDVRKNGLAYAHNNSKATCGKKYLHRVVMSRYCEIPDKMVIDHINGNGLDCRRENLRLATKAQNIANSRLNRRNKIGLKGITFDKRKKKWQARAVINGVQTHLGYFATAEAAHQRYCDQVKTMHGEYANTAGHHDRG